MAIELYFTRTNSETPWGFQLSGGAEYNTPIQVTKIADRSIAQEVGLQVNDVVVRINNVPISGITHSECNNLLSVSGNQLILAIRRDELTPTTPELENDSEVSNIFEKSIQKEEKRVHFQTVAEEFEEYTTQECPIIEKGEPPQILSTATKMEQAQHKKWSTFLQKPANPIPKPKRNEEKPKGEPYRVVITKQKKKSAEAQKEIQKETITETEIKKEESLIDENHNNNETIQMELKEEISEEEEVTIEDESEIDDESRISDKVVVEEEKKSVAEKFLEEKLAAVQKQLEALSQLPTAIQMTLDAVTKELTNIIKIKEGGIDEIEEKVSDDENTATEREASNDLTSENSVSSKSEEELFDESSVAYQQQNDDEEKSENLEEAHEELQNDDNAEDTEVEPEVQQDVDPDEGLTEEEKEAKRLERERLDKQQKIEEYQQLRLGQRPTLPLKPIDRPIILPGGRRWSQPDDACPTIRHPKMSDEKIANTIESFSEVIVGKTKGWNIGTKYGRGQIKINPSTGSVGQKKNYIGTSTTIIKESNCGLVPSTVVNTNKINFLKYQPPPAKLAHLQRSEVYKLVHDLEPPVRGICNRAEKILSEQDYYQNNIEAQ